MVTYSNENIATLLCTKLGHHQPQCVRIIHLYLKMLKSIRTKHFFLNNILCLVKLVKRNMVHWKINVRHNPFIKYNLLYGMLLLCNILCIKPQHLCNGTLYKFISPQKTFLCNFSNRVVGFIVANYISCDTVRWFSHFQKLENTSRCIVF